MMDRSEFPTEHRLQQLRAQGLVPVSLFSCRALALIVVLLAATSLTDRARTLFFAWKFDEFGLSTVQVLEENLKTVFVGLFALAIAVVLISALCVLLQTRFLFRMGTLSPQLAKLNPFRGAGLRAPFVRMVRALLMSFVALCVGTGAILLLRGDAAALLQNDSRYIVDWMSALQSAIFPILIMLLVIAALSWFVERKLFFRRHAMTREEVRREGEG